MTGVNIFGMQSGSSSSYPLPGPPGIGFRYLDEYQNFDIDDKRLANIATPLEDCDAVNKKYLEDLLKDKDLHVINHVKNMKEEINENYESRLETISIFFDAKIEKLSNIENTIDEIQQNLDSK